MLDVFKPLPTAHRLAVAADVATLGHPADVYARHPITLGWEERLKARGRRRTDYGAEFGTALPRGTVLRQGDALVVDSLQLLAVVVEQPEPVLVITPASASEWARFAYHLGNSHQPIMITDHRIICLDDLGTRQVLGQHGIAFARRQQPFTPLGLVSDHRHAAGGGQDRGR